VAASVPGRLKLVTYHTQHVGMENRRLISRISTAEIGRRFSAIVIYFIRYMFPQNRPRSLEIRFSPSPSALLPRGRPAPQTWPLCSSIGPMPSYLGLLGRLDSTVKQTSLICECLLYCRLPLLSSGVGSSSRDLEPPTSDRVLAFSCACRLFYHTLIAHLSLLSRRNSVQG
jgi:hypothetical protein